MRRPRLFRWRDPSRLQGLLFVAQRIEEALFDYTLDTYKVPSLNTHTRALEFRRTVEDIESGIVSDKGLVPIIEELSWSIESDVAASHLLGPFASQYIDVSWWERSNLKTLTSQVELLISYLRNNAYERQLLNEVRARIPDGKRKRELTKLVSDLTTEWMRRGFSRDFIFFRTRSFFFSPSGPEIDSPDCFEDFVREFSRDLRKFDVVLRLAASQHTRALVPRALGEISESLNARVGHPREIAFLEGGQDEVFLRLTDIEARDARSAAIVAKSRVAAFSRILVYHAHRQQLTVHPSSLVYDGESAVCLRKSTSPVHKEHDREARDLPRAFGETIVAFLAKGLSDDSRRRVTAALGLHASAVESEDEAVQLTSLWSALEAILPIMGDQPKIAIIFENVAARWCRYYPMRLIGQLEKDLELCVPDTYQAAKRRLPTSIPAHLHCAAIVSISQNEKLREELYGALSANPLLKFRIFQVKEATESAQSLLKLVLDHRQRVEWHIRRIYRTRNLIPHAGRSLPYLSGLVENVHSYFHRLFDNLLDVCM